MNLIWPFQDFEYFKLFFLLLLLSKKVIKEFVTFSVFQSHPCPCMIIFFAIFCTITTAYLIYMVHTLKIKLN